MKFYNKNPALRSTWFTVEFQGPWRPFAMGAEKKAWAQRHPSPGRFYGKYSSWQFENESDALLFKLRWDYNTT